MLELISSSGCNARFPRKKVAALRKEFLSILNPPSEIFQGAALPQEADETDIAHLPRLCLTFNRIHFGFLRQFIDRLNEE